MNLTVSLCLHSHNFLRQYDTTDAIITFSVILKFVCIFQNQGQEFLDYLSSVKVKKLCAKKLNKYWIQSVALLAQHYYREQELSLVIYK